VTENLFLNRHERWYYTHFLLITATWGSSKSRNSSRYYYFLLVYIQTSVPGREHIFVCVIFFIFLP